MTATLPAPTVVSIPTPGQLAASVARYRNAAPVEHAPRAVDVVDPANRAALERARFVDCAAGRHNFVPIPGRSAVCLHCPIPEDQAAKVRTASAARHVTVSR